MRPAEGIPGRRLASSYPPLGRCAEEVRAVSATATQVTVDRETLLDLLHEAHAVASTMDELAGASPSPVTDQLVRKAERVAEELFGPVPENDEGPRIEIWDEGHRRSRAFLERLAS